MQHLVCMKGLGVARCHMSRVACTHRQVCAVYRLDVQLSWCMVISPGEDSCRHWVILPVGDESCRNWAISPVGEIVAEMGWCWLLVVVPVSSANVCPGWLLLCACEVARCNCVRFLVYA
jgi:hypothetical protein